MYLHAKRLLLESTFNFFVNKLGDVTGATTVSTAAPKRMLRGKTIGNGNENDKIHHSFMRPCHQNHPGIICIREGKSVKKMSLHLFELIHRVQAKPQSNKSFSTVLQLPYTALEKTGLRTDSNQWSADNVGDVRRAMLSYSGMNNMLTIVWLLAASCANEDIRGEAAKIGGSEGGRWCQCCVVIIFVDMHLLYLLMSGYCCNVDVCITSERYFLV